MKNSRLSRKRGLSRKTVIVTRSSLVSKTSHQRRTGLSRNTPIKASRCGLKGYRRTKEDCDFHAKIVAQGCLPCRVMGRESNPMVALRVHHPEGRNLGKVFDCRERFVFCACDEHHDPSILMHTTKEIGSVHGNKRLFVRQVGTEAWCVHETYRAVRLCPPWLTVSQWEEYLGVQGKSQQEIWLAAWRSNNRVVRIAA